MKTELTSRSINRLTQYHTILREYSKNNIANITSVQIAQILKIDETQVRKDIKCINCKGKCKVGYNVNSLKAQIENVLDCNNVKRAYVIGAGNLGIALTKYLKFREFGLDIVGIFDNDEAKIGKKVSNLVINNIESLKICNSNDRVYVAILTIPNKNAQDVCDIVVKSGIKHIWNFAPTILKAPDGVEVWHENLIGSFLQFCATTKYIK